MSTDFESADQPEQSIDEILAEMAQTNLFGDIGKLMVDGRLSPEENFRSDLYSLPASVPRGFFGLHFARGEDGHIIKNPDGSPMTQDELRSKANKKPNEVSNPFLDH